MFVTFAKGLVEEQWVSVSGQIEKQRKTVKLRRVGLKNSDAECFSEFDPKRNSVDPMYYKFSTVILSS